MPLPSLPRLLAALLCVSLFATASAADYSSNSTVPAAASTEKAVKAAEPARAKLEEVIIVYKTHFDIGYTFLARDVLHKYRSEMADHVMDVIARYKDKPRAEQFVWTLSGYPMKQLLWEGQTPERRAKLEKALRDGNLAVHAFPFTTHLETAEIEDLVRGLGISSALCRQYGLPLSQGSKMSDVPGHSWILPTLFARAGIKFHHYGGPLVNRTFGMPPAFMWEGPDGSRILTIYNNGYGTSPMPPKEWPYKTWIYINMTGDNQGPPSPETMRNDIASFARQGVKARAGSFEDFVKAMDKEDLSKLPVVRSDMPDPWVYGPMSQPAACKLAQNTRPDIPAAEALAEQEKCWGVFRPDLRKPIAEAFEKSLLFSEHTWGLANQHFIRTPYGQAWDELMDQGLPPQFREMEASWKEHAELIGAAYRAIEPVYEENLTALADAVKAPGHRILVYNPLPWKRDGHVVFNSREVGGASIKPLDGGPAVPVAVEGPGIESSSVTRFVAQNLPPMGYRTYVFSNEKPAGAGLSADAATGVIESPYFKATLDAKHGRIASLIDKRSGRELVDASAPHGFGQYLYERFGYPDVQNWISKALYPNYHAHKFIFAAYDMPQQTTYASALPAEMKLTVKTSALDVCAILTGVIEGPGRPQKISIRLTLPALEPAADLEIGWQKQPDSWPEAGWICLPLKVDNPMFRLGRVGADIDPIKDVTVDNVNYRVSWIQSGVAVYDGKAGAGVGLCPKDSPLVSLGEPGLYKFEPRYEPKKPWVYINLYNNQWRTNFVAWVGDGSPMTSRVRLWSFDKFSSEAALYTPSMETRAPLRVARAACHPGHLPPTQAGITLSRKGVAVSAFGPNPDGAGTILRVWEQGGASGELSVALPAGAPYKTATPVNLRGEKTGQPAAIGGGKLTFNLPAYAPASFLLRE